MIPKSDLLPHAHYVRTLRPLLPKEAFEPSPHKLWHVGMHLGIIAACVVAVRWSSSAWLYAVAAVVSGHSSACLAFLNHDISHGAVVRGRRKKRVIETFIWAVIMTPATLWLRVHLQGHHRGANTHIDPDRKFLASEQTPATHRFSKIFMPSSSTRFWLPTVFLWFHAYVVRYTADAFSRADARLPTIIIRLPFKPGDRLRIVMEGLFIAAIQLGVFVSVGADGVKYFFVGPVAMGTATSVVMMYVFTNHLLNPHVEISDPLIATTSIIVPGWMNWFHSNLSFHTEHHVFPRLNPAYYPLVAKLLQQHWPERYHQLTLSDAWRRLWKADEFIGRDFVLNEPHGTVRVNRAERPGRRAPSSAHGARHRSRLGLADLQAGRVPWYVVMHDGARPSR